MSIARATLRQRAQMRTLRNEGILLRVPRRAFACVLLPAIGLTGCPSSPAPSDAQRGIDVGAEDAAVDANTADGGTDAPGEGDITDASAPSCPAGTSLLLAQTECGTGGSVPAGLAAQLQSAGVGDIVANVGIPGTAPCLPALVCVPGDAPTMLFSDDPESPTADGVLYADTMGPGRERVYVYHTNGGGPARKFDVVVLNQGTTDAHVTITARGLGVPSTDYTAEGTAVALAWMEPYAARTITVPAGTRVLLDPDLDALSATSGQLVHAIYDVTLDAPLKISVVTVAPGTDAATATGGLSLLGNDGLHARGTFANAARTLVLPFDGSGVRSVRLGDVPTDPSLVGRDATGGRASVTLQGNYGIEYTFQATTVGPSAWMILPRGGTWAGATSLSASVDVLGARGIPASGSSVAVGDATLLGRASRGTGFTALLMTAGGSSLPVDLVAVPLP